MTYKLRPFDGDGGSLDCTSGASLAARAALVETRLRQIGWNFGHLPNSHARRDYTQHVDYGGNPKRSTPTPRSSGLFFAVTYFQMKPTFQINVSGSLLALYGAVLATITAAVQVINHFRDRAKVLLTVKKNMKFAPPDPRYGNMTMVIITATNAGRRPITITGFGAHFLRPIEAEPNWTDWFLSDTRPSLPCEITEGKMVSAFTEQEGIDFDAIAYWYAWISTGRKCRLNVAPWYKRWLSTWHWKRARARKPAA
jgi:hypothetical protein